MSTLDIADKVERTLLQHFEDFLGLLSAFHVFFPERYQTDRRILVTEHVARINRTHERVLKKMWAVRRCLRLRRPKQKHSFLLEAPPRFRDGRCRVKSEV